MKIPVGITLVALRGLRYEGAGGFACAHPISLFLPQEAKHRLSCYFGGRLILCTYTNKMITHARLEGFRVHGNDVL